MADGGANYMHKDGDTVSTSKVNPSTLRRFLYSWRLFALLAAVVLMCNVYGINWILQSNNEVRYEPICPRPSARYCYTHK